MCYRAKLEFNKFHLQLSLTMLYERNGNNEKSLKTIRLKCNNMSNSEYDYNITI